MFATQLPKKQAENPAENVQAAKTELLELRVVAEEASRSELARMPASLPKLRTANCDLIAEEASCDDTSR